MEMGPKQCFLLRFISVAQKWGIGIEVYKSKRGERGATCSLRLLAFFLLLLPLLSQCNWWPLLTSVAWRRVSSLSSNVGTTRGKVGGRVLSRFKNRGPFPFLSLRLLFLDCLQRTALNRLVCVLRRRKSLSRMRANTVWWRYAKFYSLSESNSIKFLNFNALIKSGL